MKNLLILAAMLLALPSCSTSSPGKAPAGSWPMYRGDISGDGQPPGIQLNAIQAAHLKLAWRQELGSAIDGTPAVSDGLVIVGSAKGKLAAYRVESGARVWEDDGLGSLMGSAAIVGDLVFTGSLGSQVIAVGLRDGRIRWSWHGPTATAAIWASPIPYHGLLLVGVASQAGDVPLEAGRMFALEQASGREVWSYCVEAQCRPGGGIWSSPVIDAAGRTFVGVGNPDDAVLAFDAGSGRRLWATGFHPDFGRDLDVGAAPVIVQAGGRERVAVGSIAGDFKLLDAQTGTVVWSDQLDAGTAVHGLIGSPASDGSRLYVPSASPPMGLFALSVDGRIAWQRTTEEAVYSSPGLGRGVVLFGAGEVFGEARAGHLLALSTTDGRVLFSFKTTAPLLGSPAIAGQRVLVGDASGELRAFAP